VNRLAARYIIKAPSCPARAKNPGRFHRATLHALPRSPRHINTRGKHPLNYPAITTRDTRSLHRSLHALAPAQSRAGGFLCFFNQLRNKSRARGVSYIRITSCAEIASSGPAIRLERRDETSSRQARRRHRDGSQNRGVATMTRDIKKTKKGKRNARRENHEGRDSGGTIYVH